MLGMRTSRAVLCLPHHLRHSSRACSRAAGCAARKNKTDAAMAELEAEKAEDAAGTCARLRGLFVVLLQQVIVIT